jgi:hypothetical protein
VAVSVLVAVAVGGTGVAVKVAVGGVVAVNVEVGGTGEDVKVAEGGIGVQVGVWVSVGGRKGVHDAEGVGVIVAVKVAVEV